MNETLLKRLLKIAGMFNEWLEETAKELKISKDEVQEIVKNLM